MNAQRQDAGIVRSSFTPAPSGLLQRKCACGTHTMAGGECAECAKKKSGLQRKLAIGASNDPLEREADRVADQVMAAPAHSATSGAPLCIQRFSGQPNGQADTVPASVDRVLASSGRPLEPTLQQDMEQRFGYNFSRVRVHSDAASEKSARDVNAHAYTAGNDIVFGAGRYEPGTQEGRRLIAHELTHVVQQFGTDGNGVGQSNGNRSLPLIFHAVGPHIARQPNEPKEAEDKQSAVEADRIKAAEMEIAQALTIARSLHQKAMVIVTGATQVDLDLVDIVQAQGEAVEETLELLADSSLIAGLSEDQRKVILGAGAIELQMYMRNAEHLGVLNKNVALDLPDNVANADDVEEELDRFANWHEEWIIQNSFVADLASDLIAFSTGMEEQIEVNVLAAEKFIEYEQNLKDEGEALQKIDAEMDNFAKQASSLRTRGKVAKVAEFILSLRGRRGRFKSPPKAKPRAAPKSAPKGGLKAGSNVASKTRKQFKKPKGQTKPKNPKQRKKKTKSKKCSAALITMLNAAMHTFCDKPRSCSMQGDTCQSATAKVAAGYGCVDARTKLQQKCFSPGDPGYEGHMRQIAEANAALLNCQTVMAAKCK